jgi:hypothetical protein
MYPGLDDGSLQNECANGFFLKTYLTDEGIQRVECFFELKILHGYGDKGLYVCVNVFP